MKSLANLLVLSSCVAILCGCAAAMVPSSNDPERKLGWATVLMDEQDRPLPAERLIREAIEIYKAQNNEKGLAEGYRKYGIFFRSDAVKKSERHYREEGFLDKTVTFDQRLDKSIEYLSKSRAFYAKTNAYDVLSNIDLNLAWVYEEKGQQELACKALDSSLASNVRFKAANPDAKFKMASNYKSFADVIAREKKSAHCPEKPG